MQKDVYIFFLLFLTIEYLTIRRYSEEENLSLVEYYISRWKNGSFVCKIILFYTVKNELHYL